MFLFSTDIDGTVYDGPDTALRFARYWQSLQSRSHPPLLSYNSGRAVEDVLRLLEATSLPAPDFVIGGVGTEIYDFRNARHLEGWDRELSDGWDFERAEEVVRKSAEGVERQPEQHQNPFKCSWYWHERGDDEIRRLHDELANAGLSAQVVYSSARDLDILPAKANKGNAVTWLSRWLEISQQQIIVAGDSGNDLSMFRVTGARGIVVSNAESALLSIVDRNHVYVAEKHCAYGVIEGLEYHARADSGSASDSSVGLVE